MNHQDTKTPSNLVPLSNDLDQIGKEIVDCAFQVHTQLGPGLLESIYEEAFIFELGNRNIAFEKQKAIPVIYKGKPLTNTLRLDLLIENKVIVELKAIDQLSPIHDAQILTYMKLLPARLGYLINFNVPVIKAGIRRKAL
jgi:GxxExxY protein